MTLTKLNWSLAITITFYMIFFVLALMYGERSLLAAIFVMVSIGGAVIMYFITRLMLDTPFPKEKNEQHPG